MVLGLRIGAGAATSGAGTGAPAAPALATGYLNHGFSAWFKTLLGTSEFFKNFLSN